MSKEFVSYEEELFDYAPNGLVRKIGIKRTREVFVTKEDPDEVLEELMMKVKRQLARGAAIDYLDVK